MLEDTWYYVVSYEGCTFGLKIKEEVAFKTDIEKTLYFWITNLQIIMRWYRIDVEVNINTSTYLIKILVLWQIQRRYIKMTMLLQMWALHLAPREWCLFSPHAFWNIYILFKSSRNLLHWWAFFPLYHHFPLNQLLPSTQKPPVFTHHRQTDKQNSNNCLP